jgi:hypothetical protein
MQRRGARAPCCHANGGNGRTPQPRRAVLASPAMNALRSGISGLAIFLGMTGAGCGKGSEGGGGEADKIQLAKLAVDRLAFESTPKWMMANPSTECPDGIATIAKFIGQTEADLRDPWGTPLKLFCGKANLPPGAKGAAAALSFGPDKKEGTADDIKSWEPLKPQP